MPVIIIERTFDHYNSASFLYTNYNINNEQTTHNLRISYKSLLHGIYVPILHHIL